MSQRNLTGECDAVTFKLEIGPPSEMSLQRDPSSVNSEKTFPSTAELETTVQISEDAAGSIVHFTFGKVSLDHGTSIDDDDWLQRTEGHKEIHLSYEMGAAHFSGGSKWMVSASGDQRTRVAWADCWIGENREASQTLKLNLGFKRPSRDMLIMRLNLEGTTPNKPKVKAEVEHPMLDRLHPRLYLDFYCRLICASVASALSPALGLDWVTSEILQYYHALIEKVVSASLHEVGLRPRPQTIRVYDANGVERVIQDA